MKQRRLTEAEIQNYERGSDEQLLAYFAQLPGETVGGLFIQILRSYRDAARVANAAWLVMDESKKAGAPSQKSYERLVDALQIYAPMNFAPSQYAHDFALEVMAGVHDVTSKFSDVEAFAAWLRNYMQRLREARWHQGGNV